MANSQVVTQSKSDYILIKGISRDCLEYPIFMSKGVALQ